MNTILINKNQKTAVAVHEVIKRYRIKNYMNTLFINKNQKMLQQCMK